MNILPARNFTFLHLTHLHLRHPESEYDDFIRDDTEYLRNSLLACGEDAPVQYAYSRVSEKNEINFCF
jgi:hypothetical protein